MTPSGRTAALYEGRTILITGGRGYIGSALTQALAQVRCRIIVVDRSRPDAWTPGRGLADVSIVNGDLAEPQPWEGVLPGVDYVFHLAGTEYVRHSNADPLLDWRCNALPVVHLLEVCRARGYFPRIVFTSSANVFGRARALPVSEDAPDDPLIPWAAHKVMAESYLRIYAQRHGIQSLVVRLANIYGPSTRRSADTRVVLNRMIADAVAGRPLALYDNRTCIRDYLFVDDAVDALLLAGIPALFDEGTYVLGSGTGASVSEACGLIARQVRARTGHDVPIHYDPSVAMDHFDMRNFVADASRFRRATGWEPGVSLDQGLDVTIESMLTGDSLSGTPAAVALP